MSFHFKIQTGGWVPGQLIEWDGDIHNGIARENYTARELDVNEGDQVIATKALNGWMWCKRLSDMLGIQKSETSLVKTKLSHRNTSFKRCRNNLIRGSLYTIKQRLISHRILVTQHK
ncbi:hypothetical protein [Photorhabdus sp. SF281]|uniref:hypothetical protein n=1 Tax=Photorhabdus sp. SF281 TaxID=3459527 RepID=UPI00404437BC